ncbi:MAG: NAD(P)H-hydrate epimerase [Saprospiraceae bacterium]
MRSNTQIKNARLSSVAEPVTTVAIAGSGSYASSCQLRGEVLVCDFAGRHSTDFDAQISLNRKITRLDMVFCSTAQDLQDKWNVSAVENQLCIDALFGSGLSRPLTGEWAAAIEFLNGSGADMVSIDLPSGLFCDLTSVGNAVIETPTRQF